MVVGARKFLVAYNINLNTPDIEIAKRIAKNIRHSNGGLRYVKAMGVDLRARHLAQVSINMTDFEQTPLHRVFEMVKREAERYGVTIVGSEIVGLIPKRAIEITADFYLQLEAFSPAQVLENRLAASLSGAALEQPGKLAALAQPFLDAVAQPSATPGGGSVAALSGALAASLGHMVAALSRKKKSQAAFVDDLSDAAAEFHRAAADLSKAIDRDAASFDAVMAAYKLPQASPEEQKVRENAIQVSIARRRRSSARSRSQLCCDLRTPRTTGTHSKRVYVFRHSRGAFDGSRRRKGRARKRSHQSRIHHRC